jgi:hypothetical protein
MIQYSTNDLNYSDDILMLIRLGYQLFNDLDTRIRELETIMTTAQGIMEQFATQIDDLTTQEAQDVQAVTDELTSLKSSLDSAGQQKLQESIDRLKTTSDNLHAVANPSNPNNPVPIPTVPSDSGAPTDPNAGTGTGTMASEVSPADTLNPGTTPAP